MWRHFGASRPQLAADGSSNSFLKCGAVPDTLTTVDFGPSSEKNINSSFAAQKKHLPSGHGPLVNSEYYPGWLVLWGQKSATLPSPDEVVNSAKCRYTRFELTMELLLESLFLRN
ncbi:hypothetical protein ANCCAN_11550 [Ancylostoma caninum]|uniref:Glycoside hydrolase 35 catalytic domain-containing protein n=1 Tax=Ancylostoma caninum TaxID=29170 RepID=A0A368GDJ0_ANCCA|nr:hypothetical protein ANCCAN_11550 [Ancylostoma caninum]